jgi:orotate phosphoribosyltransferase
MMREELLERMKPRRGHFRLESGHHGDLWLEIARLQTRPRWLRPFTAKLAEKLTAHGIDVVCGPLVEGAFIAMMAAEELDREFAFAEQLAQQRSDGLFPVGYRIPEALRASLQGRRVAVVDDVINAGSAIRGALADLRACGAIPVVIGSLMVLGSPASELARQEILPLETLAHVANTVWEPSVCPLCAAGVPLGD